MDSTLVIYTGLPLPNIGVVPNTDLEVILGLIDTAFNSVSGAPSYTPFNLQCLRPTYTIDTTQEFAEAVADFICLLRSDFDTFTSTTYVTDLAAIQATLDSITDPGLVYAPFNILNTDDLATVYSKLFAGLSTMLSNIDPSGANWAGIGVGTPPTSATAAFDEIITYGLALAAVVAGKEDSLGTFDNSSNCLGGGATDDAATTINLLSSYVCTLPTFDPGSVTWDCVAPGADLQETVDNIISTFSAVATNYVSTAGTGLTLGPAISCAGKPLHIDATWPGLFKVAVDSASANLGNADYLDQVITSSDGSITIDTTTTPGVMDLVVTEPTSNKVMVNNNDANPGYLQAKIPSSGGDWGLAINTMPNYNNEQLLIVPTVNNADVLINNILNAIQQDPDLLAKFCATVDMCGGCLCDTVTDLVVTNNGTNFILTWTPAGGNATGQVAKYRPSNIVTWLTGNFSPANILSSVATTTTASGLSVNTNYQFQVDTNCPGDVGVGNIYEHIVFDKQTVTVTPVAGVVNVNQNPMPTVDVVDYRLLDQNLQVVQNVSATGINPAASFTAVSAGNYSLEYRQGTLVNGVMLYSDDVSQAGAWYLEGPFPV